MIKKYFTVWMRLAQMAFAMQMVNRWGSLGWLGGKLVRLLFFVVFLLAIFKHVNSVAGYSLQQVALFYLTFNLVDIMAQLFFRGLYMVGRDIREGDFDFYLIQPVQPLFRVSSNLVDFLDFLTLIPVLAATAFLLTHQLSGFPLPMALQRLGLYAALCANGILISFCLHVLIACLTIRTQQMENTIWMYRDLVSLGRFPVDVYNKPLQIFLTVVLPIGVMISFPAQGLLGLLSFKKIIFAFLLSGGLCVLTWKSWQNALKHYCSVSS